MLYNLFLYKRFGNKWRDTVDYFNLFHGTFPQIVSVEGGSKQELSEAYLKRVAYSWSHLFGIMEYTIEGKASATPLLGHFVNFSPKINRLLK